MTDIPAQVDCAADCSVIPTKLAEQLELVPFDEKPVSGLGGQIRLLPTHRLELGIRNLSVRLVEVIAHPEETYILLGRDVLNAHRVLLDGPALALEIE